MKTIFIVGSIWLLYGCTAPPKQAPFKEDVLHDLVLANQYFMHKWPDPAQTVTTNKERPSNLWTRAVYYEGLMSLYKIYPKQDFYQYALDWAAFHQYKFRGKQVQEPRVFTRNADNLCAAQTYIDLYLLDPDPARILPVKQCADSMINTPQRDDWDWIDALQMAMPVLAKLGAIYKDERYFDTMHEMYLATKNKIGGGLYNKEEHLWWRDAGFVPPYKEPNGKNCYWSRGNGWVLAALVRVLNELPEHHKYRNEYVKTYKEMCEAVLKVQRKDGFWNVSLHDPDHFGGKELTGTALFAYGFAWGLNHKVLSKEKYYKPLMNTWNAMSKEGLHKNGFLGYVQGTGKEPKDGQPVQYNAEPDFEDFGLGCFLLAGTELYELLRKEKNESIPKSDLTKSLESIFYDPTFIKIKKNSLCANQQGAIGDGITNNTEYIQKTIDGLAAKGGGTVYFKPGIYMTSSIFVKSNIELRIDKGVVLKAIQDDALYPQIDTRVAGIEMKWPAALINVNGQNNVRITGKGIIDGNGAYWWRKYWGNGRNDMGGMRKEYQEKGLRWIVDYDCQRVRPIVVQNSTNVQLTDLTVKRSGFWTVTLLYSSKVHVDGVIIRNNINGFGPSSDGIDTDSSSEILVENCDVDCNDDNFCLKAGRDADGLRVNKPTRNVVYRNCISRYGHGLFTIGSETSGGMENIEAYNLESYNTSIGFRLKSAKIRGGVIKNVSIHHIEMDGVKRPFQFEMNWNASYSYPKLPEGYDKDKIPEHWKKMLSKVEPEELGIPEFKDFKIANVTVKNAEIAFYANAFEEKKMRNFIWNNVTIQSNKAGTIKNSANWKMQNVEVQATDNVLHIINSENIEVPKGVIAQEE